ncbi:MAG: cadherin repeat domain-containing protein, partial [Endozoicomonas sp.]
ISALAGGGYVASWRSDHEGDYQVYARIFNAQGEAMGDEFLVNDQASMESWNKSILALADGGFMASWTVNDTDGAGLETYARRFDVNGDPVGEPFMLNDYMGGDQQQSQLAELADGRIVGVWNSAGVDGDGAGIAGKVIALEGTVKETAAAGIAVGKVEVDDPDMGDTHQFAMVDDAGGRFTIDADTGVITLTDPDLMDYNDAASHDVSVQVTDSAGHTLTQRFTVDVAPGNRAPASLTMGRVESDEFTVNQNTAGSQDEPMVTALDNGGFMSVWTNQNATASTGGDGSSYSVKARVFDAEGQPVGNEFLVNESTLNDQRMPSVTTLANGDVLVTWTSLHSGAYRIYGRRFDEDGNSLTSEFTLYEGAGTHQHEPEITALSDGGYLTTWQDSSEDGSSNGVFAQRFDANDQGMGQFRVNDYIINSQHAPDAAGLSDGGYVVAWNGRGADQTADDGVYLRQYNSNGETVAESVISSNIAGTQSDVRISALAEGGYVASWSSNHEGDYQV